MPCLPFTGDREMGPNREGSPGREEDQKTGRKGVRGEGRERVKPHGRWGSRVAAAAITFRPGLSFLQSGFTTPINVVCRTPSSCASGHVSMQPLRFFVHAATTNLCPSISLSTETFRL